MRDSYNDGNRTRQVGYNNDKNYNKVDSKKDQGKQ